MSGWQQNQRRRRRQGERQKIICLCLQKNNFTRASCYFVHFCAVVTPLRHETSQFHKPALWSR